MSKRNQGHDDSQEPISNVPERKLGHEDFTVGWICALPLEMAAARAMLDDIHDDLPIHRNDNNIYTLGGLVPTMLSWPVCQPVYMSIRFGLMVGIGGGVPNKNADIRLGDIVVSKPTTTFGGVMQYDHGKAVGEGRFERTGMLNKPHPVLLTAIAKLQADHMLDVSQIPTYLSEMVRKYPAMIPKFTYRGQDQDRLFEAEYDHIKPEDHIESEDICSDCDVSKLVPRPPRSTNDPEVHYGLIASGNQVIKYGRTRDQIARELGIFCFDMEAAGLMDNFPCLVIRGICDYADSHKNKQWRGYAAATAAAYAKEILWRIPPCQIIPKANQNYMIGWICALPLEMAAAKAMLDEIHADLPIHPNDHNTYILGTIGVHNIVIACLPSGVYGTTSAAIMATQMVFSFTSIQFVLMVGIGGGVPSEADIRLGDVVVSKPTKTFGGEVQYDSGKAVREGRFERTGMLNKPPPALLNAVAKLEANHMLQDSRIPQYLSEMILRYPAMVSKFTYRGQEQDQLFEAEYDHVNSEDVCNDCDVRKLVPRLPRPTNDPEVHYGLIASGNQVIKNGRTRDQIARELGIFCFDMEAAGLMDNFPCLVIRGICDYADSHKNKQWQGYAAATAAAYAKEVLTMIPAGQVAKTPRGATDLLFSGL